MKYLIVIGGATATGKTALSVDLAHNWNTEILSCDSRLFYRGMDIGTAKPTTVERGGVVHHFIDVCGPEETFSAGRYEKEALEVLHNIFQQHDVAFAVGGSGLFIRALTEGFDEFPTVSEAAKKEVEDLFLTKGVEGFTQRLTDLDPEYVKNAPDLQNPARLRRVLEVCLSAQQPFSSFIGKNKDARPFITIGILLEMPRQELYDRINKRVTAMVEAGLEEEAHRMLPFRQNPALQTVGYSEWFDFFDGKCSRDEAIEKIRQHTRNYAKRQGTWFRKYGDWTCFSPTESAKIQKFIQQKTNI